MPAIPRLLLASLCLAPCSLASAAVVRVEITERSDMDASGYEQYEIAYLAENPPVAGLGLAAIRDAVAWLKHDAGSLAPVRYAYAFGSSQCGRLLREFV